jgi:hypothetical protein
MRGVSSATVELTDRSRRNPRTTPRKGDTVRCASAIGIRVSDALSPRSNGSTPRPGSPIIGPPLFVNRAL